MVGFYQILPAERTRHECGWCVFLGYPSNLQFWTVFRVFPTRWWESKRQRILPTNVQTPQVPKVLQRFNNVHINLKLTVLGGLFQFGAGPFAHIKTMAPHLLARWGLKPTNPPRHTDKKPLLMPTHRTSGLSSTQFISLPCTYTNQQYGQNPPNTRPHQLNLKRTLTVALLLEKNYIKNPLWTFRNFSTDYQSCHRHYWKGVTDRSAAPVVPSYSWGSANTTINPSL